MPNFSEKALAERAKLQQQVDALNLQLTEHENQRNGYRTEIRLSAQCVTDAIVRELDYLEHRGTIASAEISCPYEMMMGDIRHLYAAEDAIKACKEKVADILATLADDEVWLEVA